MYYKNDSLQFDKWDMHFVREFGMLRAANMVLDYQSQHPFLPFLYDTWQLAHFFGTSRGKLFHTVKNCNQYYRTVNIPKKNGGVRQLNVPWGSLKVYQQAIHHNILSLLSVSPYATAYKKKTHLTANAGPHVGKKYLLKMDVTDFFGSISFRQVYSAAFHTGLFPRQIGVMLTSVCCRDDRLPQGAPTSPALSNLVMKNFDDSLGAWCKARNISYTRYCDDLTFSSQKPLYHVYAKAKNMLEDMGLSLNEDKTHFITNSQRQSVTGLTVNDKVAIERSYKQQLRQEVHYVLTYGCADALAHSRHKDSPDMNPIRYRNHLMGKVLHVLHVEPNNPWFSRALQDLKIVH